MAYSNSRACANSGSRRSSPASLGLRSTQSFFEGGHQLEKLEFALAVAITRGDAERSALLRQQIEALGGNVEEPGT
ncbi:MAG: hypothetical protein VKK03_02975 [Synechococcus sp.]|nr:hypothetical protein [Synechococcus sp.]